MSIQQTSKLRKRQARNTPNCAFLLSPRCLCCPPSPSSSPGYCCPSAAVTTTFVSFIPSQSLRLWNWSRKDPSPVRNPTANSHPPPPVNQSQSEPTLSWTPPFRAFFPDETLLSRTQQPLLVYNNHIRFVRDHFRSREAIDSWNSSLFAAAATHPLVDPLFWQPATRLCSQTQPTCYSSPPSTIRYTSVKVATTTVTASPVMANSYVTFKESLPLY